MSSGTEFVEYALSIGALELLPEGRRLKSGRISPYFFNSGFFCNGRKLSNLANAYYRVIYDKTDFPNVIFGPSYKGIAIAVALSMRIGKVGYAFNRKEAKDHGEGGMIIGDSLYGKRVGLVDDVMTTGDSLAEAFEIVIKAGGIPVWCAIAFDRQEQGNESNLSAVQEFEAKYHIPVRAAATLKDLISALLRAAQFFPEKQNALHKILEYRKKYGVK